MPKEKKEREINNTYQIVEDFKPGFCPPRPWKRNNVAIRNRPGKVKVYTEKEIFLYMIKNIKATTLCGN